MTTTLGRGIARIGTLKDFANAKSLLERAGYKVDIVKSPNDLIRKLVVLNEEVVNIARLGGTMWAFRYNKKYFGPVS